MTSLLCSQEKTRFSSSFILLFSQQLLVHFYDQNILQLSWHRLPMRNENNVLCTAENRPVMNGDITAECIKSSDICDSTDVNSETTVIGPKPSAERCRLFDAGDQLHTDTECPLSATSPVSENGEDCCASVSGNDNCSSVGMFDSDTDVFSNLGTIFAWPDTFMTMIIRTKVGAPHGAGAPLPLLFPPCPFTSSSFTLFLLFPFSFSCSLYLFSSFVHPFPFCQNSPTLFPGWWS